MWNPFPNTRDFSSLALCYISTNLTPECYVHTSTLRFNVPVAYSLPHSNISHLLINVLNSSLHTYLMTWDSVEHASSCCLLLMLLFKKWMHYVEIMPVTILFIQTKSDDIKLSQLWTSSIVMYFILKLNSTQLYRFVRTSQETHHVSATSPTG
jgi:hypothetical protein